MNMVRCTAAVLTVLALLAVLVPGAAAQQSGTAQVVVRDITVGEGKTAVDGARVVVQYVGYLTDGTKFDSSYDRGRPFDFTIGQGEVIAGWELGVKGMRVGGVRELIIPPELAYGERGASDVIPPNATLRFEIELMGVEVSTYSLVSPEELKGLLGSTLVVDIRADSAHTQGSIPGAIGLEAFDEKGKLNRKFLAHLLKHASKTDPIVLVDKDGRQATFLGRFLAQKVGFKDLRGLDGGLDAWRDKGFELTK
jgi:rhodanese-related sulfurtransferase